MTRSLHLGVALVSVAAGAVLWAASPGCEGGFCIDRRVAAEARPDGAVAVPGIGREILVGSVDEPVFRQLEFCFAFRGFLFVLFFRFLDQTQSTE